MVNLMLSWREAALLAAALGVLAVVLHVVARSRARLAEAIVLEAGIIAALYAFWQLLGELSFMKATHAIARARWIARVEHDAFLPSERSVQNLIIGHPWLVQGANLFYATMHFGMMGVFLVWLFVRHRERYPAIRTTLALATLACLFIQLVPVAPPRMLPGYLDTAQAYGQSVYGGGWSADQLSAMPSVHVLWAVVIGWYVWRVGRGPWRALGPAHAVITILVVVATGNHWWLDGIVAVAVLAACAALRYGVARAWSARPRAAAPAEPEAAPVPAAVGH